MIFPVLAGLGCLLMSNPKRRRRRKARRNPMHGILYQTANHYVVAAADPKKGFEVYRNEGTGAVRVARIGNGPSLGLPRAIAEADRREARVAKDNPPASPLDEVAMKAESKTLGFADLLPFVKQASMIDLYVNYLYVERFAEKLPQFNLFIGDDEISYENNGTPKIRILRRSDLKNTKNGAIYGTVLVSEQWGLSKRGEKKLAAALVARVTGVIPWYHTSHMASWRLAKSNPRRAKRRRK